MSQRNEYVVCPVCKSGISNDMIIPIYSSANKAPHPKDQLDSKNSEANKPKDSVPERPRAERADPVRNRNVNQPMFRRLSENERSDLAQNNFLYNLSQLIAFLGSNRYSWERVERTIYQSRREAFERRGKYAGWEFYCTLVAAALISLALFDIDLYF